MNSRLTGLLILGIVVVLSLAYFFIFSDGNSRGITTRRVEISGFIGSEKSNFLDNPKIKTILRNKYGLIVNYQKAGSIEMVNRPENGEADFLWPSSQVALEMYKMKNPDNVKSEIIFNSPIVLYSWDLVSDALEKKGLIEKERGTYYITHFDKLLKMVIDETSWKDLALEALYGKLSIISTDPTKSNSGNMFAGLIANIIRGDVVDSTSIEAILPQITSFFARLGYMEHSTGILFEQYLSKGVGSYPLIVGYENQIVEFSLQHKDVWPRVKDKMRILYPVPTVWSSHPLIALTDNGKLFLTALQDDDLQNLAWEEHGFRTGLIGVDNDPSILQITGIPEDVTKVIPMPTPQVMQRIVEALEAK